MVGPGKKPQKSMAQVMAEREQQARQNLQKRAEKIAKLVEDLACPQAKFLLLDPRNLRTFTEQHNIKPDELDHLKARLHQRAQQL